MDTLANKILESLLAELPDNSEFKKYFVNRYGSRFGKNETKIEMWQRLAEDVEFVGSSKVVSYGFVDVGAESLNLVSEGNFFRKRFVYLGGQSASFPGIYLKK